MNNEPIEIVAPLPKDFSAVLNQLVGMVAGIVESLTYERAWCSDGRFANRAAFLPRVTSAHQRRDQPLLEVQPILSLREDEALRAFHHPFADLQPTVRRQAVQDDRVGRGLGH